MYQNGTSQQNFLWLTCTLDSKPKIRFEHLNLVLE